jgi:1-deoxy-D-xylulose-5-phosphate reductoisomerase
LAFKALERAGTSGASLNLANDITVDLFLKNKILFTDIPRINEIILEDHPWIEHPSLDDINDLEIWVKNKINDS